MVLAQFAMAILSRSVRRAAHRILYDAPGLVCFLRQPTYGRNRIPRKPARDDGSTHRIGGRHNPVKPARNAILAVVSWLYERTWSRRIDVARRKRHWRCDADLDSDCLRRHLDGVVAL